MLFNQITGSQGSLSKEKQAEIFSALRDPNNKNSPKHDIRLLRFALQGDENWAGRDKEIREGRQNTPVRDDTYKQFLKLKPTQTRTSLIAAYGDKRRELKAAKSGASVIGKAVPTISQAYCSYNTQVAEVLLAEKVERPELSEREKTLFALLQSGATNDLSQRSAVFRNSETTECPYCFQPVTPEYKASLVDSIEKILNKAVAEHQNRLKELLLAPITIDLSPYVQLEEYATCADLLSRTNEAIQSCNELLNEKIDSPYAPIDNVTISVSTLSVQLHDALAALESSRTEHNKKATATVPIITALKKINSEIAYYDVVNLAAQLEQHEQEYATAEQEYRSLKNAYEARKTEVEDLESQRKNVKLTSTHASQRSQRSRVQFEILVSRHQGQSSHYLTEPSAFIAYQRHTAPAVLTWMPGHFASISRN